MMNGEDKDEFRSKFDEFVKSSSRSDKSKALPDDQYDDIVKVLKDGHGDKILKKKIRRNGYKLMNYPKIGLKDALFIPLKEGKSNERKKIKKKDVVDGNELDAKEMKGARNEVTEERAETIKLTDNSLFSNHRKVFRINEMFDLVKECHSSESVHAGEKKTYQNVCQFACNVSMAIVKFFIENCVPCSSKKPQLSVAKLTPIVSRFFMDRMQIDLIDMTHDPDEKFRYIGHIVDHFSKYRVIFALKSKQPAEVGLHVKARYLAYFGLPKIVQSDNGAEFVDLIIRAIIVLWPGNARIINGSPRHSQSQGLVEQGNCDIEKKISALRAERKCKSWVKLLPEIQYAMNTTVVSSTKKTPYSIVFGQHPNRLAAFGVKFDEPVINEEELRDIIVPVAQDTLAEAEAKAEPETVQENDAASSFEPTCSKRKAIRDEVNSNLELSRNKMQEKYQRKKGKRVASFSVGEHVGLLIPEKIRKKADIKRLPCIVLQKSNNRHCESFSLMSEYGILNGKFTASELEKYPGQVNGLDDVKLSLNAASLKLLGKEAISCKCSTFCSNNLCVCFKNSVPCSSKCHKGMNQNCRNKELNFRFEEVVLPRYGGLYGSNNTIYTFTNTCPLDTWFAIFQFVEPRISSQVKSKRFQSLLELLSRNDFVGGRMLVANAKGIQPKKQIIDFFGSEHELIIDLFLDENFKSVVESQCDSKECTNSHALRSLSQCPSKLEGQTIEHSLKEWFFEESYTVCGEPVVDENITNKYECNNTETGEVTYHCSGYRRTNQRVVLEQPILLPLILCETETLSTSDFPTYLTVDENIKFRLQALTLNKKSHYSAIINTKQGWIYYDGKEIPCVKKMPRFEVPKGFIPSYCLYVVDQNDYNENKDVGLEIKVPLDTLDFVFNQGEDILVNQSLQSVLSDSMSPVQQSEDFKDLVNGELLPVTEDEINSHVLYDERKSNDEQQTRQNLGCNNEDPMCIDDEEDEQSNRNDDVTFQRCSGSEGGSCFIDNTPTEALQKIINRSQTAINILISKPFGQALFSNDLRSVIFHWLNDTVMDSYLKHLFKENRFFSTKKRLIGTYSIGSHWRLLIVYPKDQSIWLVDPLGETVDIMNQTKQAWQSCMKVNFPNKTNVWKTKQVNHAKQLDAISCGVFCLKFAECILNGRELCSTFSEDDVNAFRRTIAIKLIELGGNGKWCKEYCRICDRKSPPPLTLPTGKNDQWVVCDQCSPEMWYHAGCLGIKETSQLKDVSYVCNKPIVKDEKLSLAMDETLIRKRANKQIRKCGGCSVPISEASLDPPHDMVLLKKMLRPKRNCSWQSKKEDDFVVASVHYHVQPGCIKDIDLGKVILSRDMHLLASHRERLSDIGVNVDSLI
ncbi:uncharacterized protein [Clytia hemisphaerica]|uniref:uncharacterized protein isoform X2 n=1 Tax=Clytia hemisphaerica TaxID=252671 RepID=UPI0034D77557